MPKLESRTNLKFKTKVQILREEKKNVHPLSKSPRTKRLGKERNTVAIALNTTTCILFFLFLFLCPSLLLLSIWSHKTPKKQIKFVPLIRFQTLVTYLTVTQIPLAPPFQHCKIAKPSYSTSNFFSFFFFLQKKKGKKIKS